jgi:adenylate cyclase
MAILHGGPCPADNIEVGFEFAQRATQLNENFAPGYSALAVECVYRGRPTDGLVAIDRALRLSPTDPQRFTWLANRASAL